MKRKRISFATQLACLALVALTLYFSRRQLAQLPRPSLLSGNSNETPAGSNNGMVLLDNDLGLPQLHADLVHRCSVADQPRGLCQSHHGAW